MRRAARIRSSTACTSAPSTTPPVTTHRSLFAILARFILRAECEQYVRPIVIKEYNSSWMMYDVVLQGDLLAAVRSSSNAGTTGTCIPAAAGGCTCCGSS
jgi:hypothetical protein